jgi:2-polyprenyl-3-methyl-5-hydroxy-6-metoxy-1,4-benzoquinol methylase
MDEGGWHRRASCALCDSNRLEQVLALEPSPPANSFVPFERLDVVQQKFPLDLAICRDCSHVQLLDVVDPRILFEDYVYVSGTSPVFVDHFRRYAADTAELLGLASGDFVVDIGSNDGTLLRFFQAAGCKVLGIDPARSIAEAASASGVETLTEFFTPDVAREIRDSRGAARLITANNVFAHAEDLGAILDGVRALLSADGVFVFEVSYLVDVYEQTLFDTIYHEHLSYHSVGPLEKFFAANSMELIDVLRVPSHGGSIRGFAQLAKGKRPIRRSVHDLIELESHLMLDRPATFESFAARINGLKAELRTLLARIKGDGACVSGFGAPAKATTLLHHFELGPEFIDFIVDDSPLKQGLFTPGHHIPVLSPAVLEERHPDYLVVLAWNFAQSIIASHAGYTSRGGQFIVPLPQLKLYGPRD